MYCAMILGVTCSTPITEEITTKTPITVGVVKLSSNVPTIGIETIPPTKYEQTEVIGGYVVMRRQINGLLFHRPHRRANSGPSATP